MNLGSLGRVSAHARTRVRTNERTNEDVRDDDERPHGGRCRGQGARGYVGYRCDATTTNDELDDERRGFQLRLTATIFVWFFTYDAATTRRCGVVRRVNIAANAGSSMASSSTVVETETERASAWARFGAEYRRQGALGRALVDSSDAGAKTAAKAAATPLFTLAAVTMVDRKMIGLVTQSVASFIKLYLLLLFVRVLLTWFPNVNWMRQPWTMLRQVTDPYLNLFRNLIPPVMGQIDFTPILGFMVLQFLARVLSSGEAGLGKF